MKPMLATLQRAIAPLSLAMLLSACAAVAPGDHYTAPPAGMSFTSAYTDSGSFGSGKSVVPSQVVARGWNGTPAVGFQNPQGTLIMLPQGTFVGLLGPDGKMAISWEPGTVWDFPLTVGKSWTKQYKAKFHAQNREVPFETKQVVEAYEEIVVPAGTFKTFRVRSSDTLGNENVHWFAPDVGIFVKTSLRRTDKNASGAGTRETELQTLKRSSN
jgi:hypothetical protein